MRHPMPREVQASAVVDMGFEYRAFNLIPALCACCRYVVAEIECIWIQKRHAVARR